MRYATQQQQKRSARNHSYLPAGTGMLAEVALSVLSVSTPDISSLKSDDCWGGIDGTQGAEVGTLAPDMTASIAKLSVVFQMSKESGEMMRSSGGFFQSSSHTATPIFANLSLSARAMSLHPPFVVSLFLLSLMSCLIFSIC